MVNINELQIEIFSNKEKIILKEEEIKKCENEDYGNPIDIEEIEKFKKIKENEWNHLTFIYDSSQTKKIQILLNCTHILYSNNPLMEEFFKDQNIQIGKENFDGEITEFKFWKIALNAIDIKKFYRIPLDIVFLKKKKINLQIKEKKKKSKSRIKTCNIQK